MDRAVGIQHLQFTAEIWTTDTDLPLRAKDNKVQVVTNYELPFLYMKMSWSPEWDLLFSVFRKKGQQLKYIRMISKHTPSTIHAIPSGVLNRLAKLILKKPFLNSERVDKICPDHASALCKADLAPLKFPTMGEL